MERNIMQIDDTGITINGALKGLEVELLEELKNEQRLLLAKIKKAREEDNIGTYKNLIQALREITYLVQNEEIRIESKRRKENTLRTLNKK